MITLAGSTTLAATANTGNLPVKHELTALYVNVTAISGTNPTLVVKLQESPDLGTTWVDIPSFNTASLTATGLVRVAVPTIGLKVDGFLRAVCTVGGTTPSVTFTVSVGAIRSSYWAA
jgi:hypothetical protein